MTDIINVSGQEFDKLLDKIYNITSSEYDLYEFEEVPLPKVTLCLKGSNGNTSTFYYQFDKDNSSLIVDVEHKFEIRYFYTKDVDKVHVEYNVTGTVPKNWLETLNSLDSNNPNVSGWRAVHLTYWNLEYALRHLPSVYVITNERKVYKKGKGKHIKHVVKLINRYRLNNDVLNNKGTIVFTCPAWGVRGHYRLNPKTGIRDIWVKAYVKGKERNNPEKYVSKEYLL